MVQKYIPSRPFKIYGLYDPTDPKKKVRYVGATQYTADDRLEDHLEDAQKKKPITHKQKWIRKLLRRGVTPAIRILETQVTKTDWKERERYWIKFYRDAGNRLTNSTDGGEGLINPTKDVRRRIGAKVSAGLTGNQRRKGISHTLEHRAAISVGLLNSTKARRAWKARKGKPGHPCSEAAKQAISLANKGNYRPDAVALAKKQAEKNRGSYWANDGSKNHLVRPGKSMPKGYVMGRLVPWNSERHWSMSARLKIARANKGNPGPRGLRWITDGSQVCSIPKGQEPPLGWRFGRF